MSIMTPILFGQADRSIAIDPDDPLPYFAKSFYLSFVLHRPEEGLRAAVAGLALNPGSAFLYYASGMGKIQAGMFAHSQNPTYCMPFNSVLGIRAWVFGYSHWPHPT